MVSALSSIDPIAFGIMLTILVNSDNPVSARTRHTRQGRCVLAKVTREPDWPDVVIALAECSNRYIREIGAGVVDKNDLRKPIAVSAGDDVVPK